jgi:hypothetical protein
VAESEERIFRSGYFDFDSGVDLFYSYSTCNSTAEDWLKEADGVLGNSIFDGSKTQLFDIVVCQHRPLVIPSYLILS